MTEFTLLSTQLSQVNTIVNILAAVRLAFQLTVKYGQV
jgi:hypothetical protein